MANRTLPALDTIAPAANPIASTLQKSLARMVTSEEIDRIVQQILEEAKTGNAAEKRAARQLLFGLIGAKTATPATLNVQNNYYGGKRKAGSTGGGSKITSLIVRYLESSGPAPVELIAAELAQPVRAVAECLESSEQFRRRPGPGGATWSLASMTKPRCRSSVA